MIRVIFSQTLLGVIVSVLYTCKLFYFQFTFIYETNNRTYGHTTEVLVTVVVGVMHSNNVNKPVKQNLISYCDHICYLSKRTLY